MKFLDQIESTVATGEAPLSVASTTVVTNLNADLLDGSHSSAFATSGHVHAATDITNTPAGNIAATNVQTALNELDTEKQAVLVSGTSIKTINSTSLLGSGDVAVQATLVSGTNIKTINSESLLGSGDIVISSSDGSSAAKSFFMAGW